MTIWAVSSDGGSPTRLVEMPDLGTPRWSPDGEWLVFRASGNRVLRGIWLKHSSETEPEMLATGHGVPRWSLDGQRVFFRRLESGVARTAHERADLWAVDLEARTERRLTDLYGRAGRLMDALATDGTYLYFVWREDLGDIWVMDVVQ